MANLALLRDSSCRVIRIIRPLKVFQVAGNARRCGDVVVAVGVALCTGNLRVGARQGEGCFRMIKRGRLPGGRGVANLALLWDASGQVIRARGALEVLEVARDACGRRQIEISVRVTLIALQLRMPTRKREAHRIVIEAGWLPCRSRVAILASLGEAQGQMIGVAGFLEIRQMATHTCRRRPLIFPSCMTGRALQRSVHARQGKSSEPQVIEHDALPVVNGVALLALSRETGGHVVGRGGLLERFLVTRIALDR